MKNRTKNILPIIFLTACTCLLLWPAFTALGLLPARADAHEKRIPAEFPTPPNDKQSLEKWPRGVDKYLSDNIPHRGYLIASNAMVKYFGFRSTSTPEVMVGKGGWLFHNIEVVNAEIQGLVHREPYQVRRMRITLEERKAWLEERGIAYLVLIAPSKHLIYYDKLPDWIKVDWSKPSRRKLLLENIRTSRSDLQIFDFTPVLLKAREKWGDELYYKYDTHWNYRGSFEAYKALSRAYPQWFDAPGSDWVGQPAERETNLMQMMGLSIIDSAAFIQPPGGFKLKKLNNDTEWQQKLKKKGAFNWYKNPNAKKKKLFVMGDSFLTWNAQYFAHNFSETATSNTWGQQWKRYEQFPWKGIAYINPDLVIEQMVENRLDIGKLTSFLTDPKGKNHPEFIREARIRLLAEKTGMETCHVEQFGKEMKISIPTALQGKKAFIIQLEVTVEGSGKLESISPYPARKAWEDLCIRGGEMTSREFPKGIKEIWICAASKPGDRTLKIQISPGSGPIRVKRAALAVHPDV
jgi:hypothetical protein